MQFEKPLKSALFYNLAANAGLILGNITGHWNFTSTMTCYLYEILLLTLLGAVYYMHPKRSGDPGMLLFAGAFIILICLLFTISIGESIGELPHRNSFEYYLKILPHAWPILAVISISLLLSFFKIKKHERELSLQTTLFYKILFSGISLGLAALAISFLHEGAKLFILLIVILTRLGLEYYLNPNSFKELFKKYKSHTSSK